MPQIYLATDSHFNNNSACYTDIDETIPEQEFIWIWDHLFSLGLNRLGGTPEATQLLNDLTSWAREAAQAMKSSADSLESSGVMRIDKQMLIQPLVESIDEIYLIETEAETESWPSVRIQLPELITPDRLAKSVIALAQHFISESRLFFQDLPLHIMLMNKYYQEENTFTEEQSISQAPAYAMQIAQEFYRQLNEKE